MTPVIVTVFNEQTVDAVGAITGHRFRLRATDTDSGASEDREYALQPAEFGADISGIIDREAQLLLRDLINIVTPPKTLDVSAAYAIQADAKTGLAQVTFDATVVPVPVAVVAADVIAEVAPAPGMGKVQP
jgi:hypothetical protein